jgi:hypothetical protein
VLSQPNIQPSQPISPGNVITIAIAVYRANLKTYFRLALIATFGYVFPSTDGANMWPSLG